MTSPVREQSLIPAYPLVVFRIAFASIWLTYDVLDLWLHGTEGYFLKNWTPALHFELLGVQLVLILFEIVFLSGYRPQLMALVLFLARGFEAWLFHLNDFFYFCVVALIFTQIAPDSDHQDKAPAWPRDVLVWQTAWIYFASAVLKLNPAFLSGGDLYVRQNYLARALDWPYPAFYTRWISTLHGNAVLAWLGVAAEFALAAALAGWWFCPGKRTIFRRLAIILGLAVHGMGALALNVFFFGASMVSQVVLTTWEP